MIVDCNKKQQRQTLSSDYFTKAYKNAMFDNYKCQEATRALVTKVHKGHMKDP